MESREIAAALALVLPLLGVALSLRPARVEAPPQPLGVAVTDMTGRPTVVAVPPRKVVMLPPFLARYLAVDGDAERLVGTSRVAAEALRGALSGATYPAASSIAQIANGVDPQDPEALLALHPDTTFVWSNAVPGLVRLGMPGVVGLQGDPRNPEGMLTRMMAVLGQVSGKSVRAQWLLHRWQDQRQALAGMIPKTAPPVTIAVLYRGSGIGQIGGRYAHLNEAIRFIGARNAAAGRPLTANSSLEDLYLLNPDIIILTSDYDRSPEQLFADQAWQPLQAVRQRRIYRMPQLTDVNGPVDDPLFIDWLAELADAELADADQMPHLWRQMFSRSCQAVYGIVPSDLLTDTVLEYRQNRLSRGYDRFIRQSTH